MSDAVSFGRPVWARAPASSANLGPGFDSLALALALHDEVSAEALPRGGFGPNGVEISVVGQGADTVPLTEDHLVVRSLRAGWAQAGLGRPEEQPAVRLSCHNAIPHGRGLGSSAAAVAVGLVLARGLLVDRERLSDQAIFDLATAAEGHPDNASAALFGGCVLSWTEAGGARPGRAHAVRLDVDPRVQAAVCIPGTELATSRARAMLPATVPHADAAFNAGRVGLLVHALASRPDLLLAATEDRLHQDQRAPAMPASAALLAAVRRRGVAATISGAGPSILVLGEAGTALSAVREALAEAGAGAGTWRVLPLGLDPAGTVLIGDDAETGARGALDPASTGVAGVTE